MSTRREKDRFDAWLSREPEDWPDDADEIDVEMPDPCDQCGWVGLHEPECAARPFPFVVTTRRHALLSSGMTGGFDVRTREHDELVLSSLVDNTECAEAMRTLVLYAQTADTLGRMADTIQLLSRRLARWEGSNESKDNPL